jgi:hypothetical protein
MSRFNAIPVDCRIRTIPGLTPMQKEAWLPLLGWLPRLAGWALPHLGRFAGWVARGGGPAANAAGKAVPAMSNVVGRAGVWTADKLKTGGQWGAGIVKRDARTAARAAESKAFHTAVQSNKLPMNPGNWTDAHRATLANALPGVRAQMALQPKPGMGTLGQMGIMMGLGQGINMLMPGGGGGEAPQQPGGMPDQPPMYGQDPNMMMGMQGQQPGMTRYACALRDVKDALHERALAFRLGVEEFCKRAELDEDDVAAMHKLLDKQGGWSLSIGDDTPYQKIEPGPEMRSAMAGGTGGNQALGRSGAQNYKMMGDRYRQLVDSWMMSPRRAMQRAVREAGGDRYVFRQMMERHPADFPQGQDFSRQRGRRRGGFSGSPRQAGPGGTMPSPQGVAGPMSPVPSMSPAGSADEVGAAAGWWPASPTPRGSFSPPVSAPPPTPVAPVPASPSTPAATVPASPSTPAGRPWWDSSAASPDLVPTAGADLSRPASRLRTLASASDWLTDRLLKRAARGPRMSAAQNAARNRFMVAHMPSPAAGPQAGMQAGPAGPAVGPPQPAAPAPAVSAPAATMPAAAPKPMQPVPGAMQLNTFGFEPRPLNAAT